jgi:hypothetical protein
MRKWLLVLSLFIGCDQAQHETAPPLKLEAIPLLKDCVLVSIDPGPWDQPTMHIIRCPHSTAASTYNCGKGCKRDIVVDSEEIPSPSKQMHCSHSSGATYTCTEEQP